MSIEQSEVQKSGFGETAKPLPIDFSKMFELQPNVSKKEEDATPHRAYSEEELDKKDPFTGRPLRELFAWKKEKENKHKKTEEEKAEKREKEERERAVERVYIFLNRMLQMQETFATFKHSEFDFEDDIEAYREAMKDTHKGNFEKAKKLIYKEMKHARLANMMDLGTDYSSKLSHAQSWFEHLSHGKGKKSEEETLEKVGNLMDHIINCLDALTKFEDSPLNFDKKLERFREAKKDIEKGGYEKAKELIKKELKHSRLAETVAFDTDSFETYSTIYSAIEKLEKSA